MTSNDKIKELIKCKLDVFYFLDNYIYIEEPGSVTSFKPYEKQKELIKNILEDHYIIVLKSRQIGISTIVQAFCVYLITFFSNISIGVISRDGPESTDFARKCRIMFESLPRWMRPKYIKKTEQTFELSNNSRIIASQVNLSNPQSLFRGKVITFLVIDEAAFIRKISEAFTGMIPSVMRAHKVAEEKGIPYGIIALSTPNGTTDVGEWFYQMYINAEKGDSGFKAMRIHYSDAPFTDEAWLEEQKRILRSSGKGDDAIDQELELKFISSSNSLFEKETFSLLQEKLVHTIDPVNILDRVYFNSKGKKVGTGKWEFYNDLNKDQVYLIGVDVAPSYGTCNSSIQVTNLNLEQEAEYIGKMRVMDLEEEIIFIMTMLPNAFLIVEANTYATEMVERLEEHPDIGNRMYYRKKYDKKGKITDIQPGLLTDTKTKPKIMTSLYWAITESPDRVKSKNFAIELISLNKNYSSKRLTDRVMAYALITYVKDHEPHEIPESPINIQQSEITNSGLFANKHIFKDQNLYQDKIQKSKRKLTDDELKDSIFSDEKKYYDPADLIEEKPLGGLF